MATTTVANARQDGAAVEDATGRSHQADVRRGAEIRSSPGLDVLRTELHLSRDAGVPVRMWWRDDDLVANSRGFDALIGLARTFRAPLLVAIIPGLASEALDVSEADPDLIDFCQHGWRHINHQPLGGGKSEFGAGRDPEAVEAEIAAGQVALARLLGDRSRPIFVPPWNAFDERHLDIVRARGFTGLSTFGPRPRAFAVDGLRLANTHLDILQWEAPGGPRPVPFDDACLRLARIVREQREKPEADAEPIGILSHHRAMREESWSLLEGLLSAFAGVPGVSWLTPSQVFAPPPA